ncbi:EF-hand domain-containing protein [Rhizorhapis sp. SPR117]|uniref:EF-hand domain-containing protein n=1 Tax=Rhizorhapis sp. SPR117 TaxID=2912611 RepID=UPI001F2F3161|nr:EF-hand domain-containing protein [Rhizorhapis sp. SPR117]
MIRTLICSTALILAVPAIAQTAAEPVPQQEMPGASGQVPSEPAEPSQAQGASTVDVAAVVDGEFPTYDSDKSGDLDQSEFAQWMTTLKKAEMASTGNVLGDQELTAWVGAAFTMADQDKSKTVSKNELVTYLGG